MRDIIFEALDEYRQYAGVNMDKEFAELERIRGAAASRELMEERLGRLEADLKNVLGMVQKYQPAGSPPGNVGVLAKWVLEYLEQRAEMAEYVVANINKICDEIGFPSQPDWAVAEMADELQRLRGLNNQKHGEHYDNIKIIREALYRMAAAMEVYGKEPTIETPPIEERPIHGFYPFRALEAIESGFMRTKTELVSIKNALENLLGRFTRPCHPGEPSMKAMVSVRELDRYRAALKGEDWHETI